jgi:hypothetical protein
MRTLALTTGLAVFLIAFTTPAAAQDPALDNLLRELEVILEAEKAKPDHDEALVRRLEGLVRQYRERSRARSGDDGSSDEGESGGGGGGGGGERGGGGRGGGGGDWASRAVSGAIDRLLNDVELTEAERKVVVRILTEFYESWQLVRTVSDLDSLPEIERDRNNRLSKAVGRKRAKEIIEATDAMVRRWSWRDRRGR